MKKALDERSAELQQLQEDLTRREETVRRHVERLKEAGRKLGGKRKEFGERCALWAEEQQTAADAAARTSAQIEAARREVLTLRQELPELAYTCTLALSRRTWSLPDHRLPTVCEHIGHRLAQHHRADADAEAAAHIMIAAMHGHGTTSLAELARAARLPLRRSQALAATMIPVSAPAPRPSLSGFPFFVTFMCRFGKSIPAGETR